MLQPKKGGKRNTVAATQYDDQFQQIEPTKFLLGDPSSEALEAAQRYEGTFGILSKEKFDEFEKAGIDYVPGMDIQKQLAAHQSGGQQLWRTLKRGGVGIVAAAVEPFAYVLDFEHHLKTLQGVETNYDNWLSKLLRDAEEGVRESNPIYTSTPTPDLMSAEWFAQNGDQMIRSLGYLVPGSQFFKAGTWASKLAMGKMANALGASATSTAGAVNVSGAVLSGMALNYGEHAVSAVKHIEESYPRLLQHYVNQGMDPSQAEEKARQEAYLQAEDIVWGGKINIMWQSISQLNLFRNIGYTRRAGLVNTSAKTPLLKEGLKRVGIEMPTEYMEESTTGFLEAEAKHRVDEELGIRLKDYRPTHERWVDHMGSYQGMSEGLTGAFGAGPVGTVSTIMQRKQLKASIENAKELEAKLGNNAKFNDLNEESFYQHAVGSAYSGTYENFMDILEGYKNMSEEEAANLEVAENYKEIADQYIKDAKVVEDMFNELLQDPKTKDPGALEILLSTRINQHKNANRVRAYKQELDELKAEKTQLMQDIANNPELAPLYAIQELQLQVEAAEKSLKDKQEQLKSEQEKFSSEPYLFTPESNERLNHVKDGVKNAKKHLKERKEALDFKLKDEATFKETTIQEIKKRVSEIETSSELDAKIIETQTRYNTAKINRETASAYYDIYIKFPERLKADGKKLQDDATEKDKKEKAAKEKSNNNKKQSFTQKAAAKAKAAVNVVKNTLSPEKEAELIDRIGKIATLEELAAEETRLAADKKKSPLVGEAITRRRTVLKFEDGPVVSPGGQVQPKTTTTTTPSPKKESPKPNQLDILNKIQALNNMVGETVENTETQESEYPVALESGEVSATRVSTAIRNAFQESAPTGGEFNLEWGNLVDFIGENAIQLLPDAIRQTGKKSTKEVIAVVSQKILNTLDPYLKREDRLADVDFAKFENIETVVESIYNLMTTYPDAVFDAQRKIFNTKGDKTIAGATDIMLTFPDGRSWIIDLKASITSTQITKYEDNGMFTSKKIRHTRQQSMYKYMYDEQGIPVEKIFILPFLLTADQNIITDVKQEPLIELEYNQAIVDKVFKHLTSAEQHLSPIFEGDISNEGQEINSSDLNMANSNVIPKSVVEVFEDNGEGKSQQLLSSQSAGYVSIEYQEVDVTLPDGKVVKKKLSKSNTVDGKYADSVHTTRNLQVGSSVVLELRSPNTNKKITSEELANMTEEEIVKLPIVIQQVIDGALTDIAPMHSVEWVQRENSETTAEEQAQKAKNLRLVLAKNEDQVAESNVIFKGSGLVLQMFEEEENGDLATVNNNLIPANRPVKESMPDWNNLEIGIVNTGIIYSSKGVETKKSLSNDFFIDNGRVVVMIPTPNGTFFPAVLWADNISDTQAQTIIGSAVSFVTDNIETHQTVSDATGLDFGRDGAKTAFHSFINRYVYASPYSYKYEEEEFGRIEGQRKVLVYTPTELRNQLIVLDVDNRTIYTNEPNYFFEDINTIQTNDSGVYTGELKQYFVDNKIEQVVSINYEDGANKATELLKRKLVSVDAKRINKPGEFSDVQLDKKGNVALDVNRNPIINKHNSYNSFKLDNLKTDINGQNKIEHKDGAIEHTYMTQPTVLVDLDFVSNNILNENAIDDGDSIVKGNDQFFSIDFENTVEKTEEEKVISLKLKEELEEDAIDLDNLSQEMQDQYIEGVFHLYADLIVNHKKSFDFVSINLKRHLEERLATYKRKGVKKARAYQTLLDNFNRKGSQTTVEALILAKLKELDIVPTKAGFESREYSEEEIAEFLNEQLTEEGLKDADFTEESYDIEFYRADRKKTASAEVKFFLSSISDSNNINWAGYPMGIKYQDAYDTLKSILTDIKGGLSSKIAAVELATPSPVYKNILQKLKNQSLDFQNKFVVAMSGTKLNFVQVLSDPKSPSKTKVIAADNYGTIANVKEKWLNHLKQSEVVKEVKDELVIDPKKVLAIKAEYMAKLKIAQNLKKDTKNNIYSDKFLGELQSILRRLGMEVPIGGLRYISSSATNLAAYVRRKGTWEAQIRPNGRGFMQFIFDSLGNEEIQEAIKYKLGEISVPSENKETAENIVNERIESGSGGLFYINNPIEGPNQERSVIGLAKLTVDYNGVIFGNNFRGEGGKAIYAYSLAFGMQRLLSNYKDNLRGGYNSLENLLTLNASQGSTWGEKLLEENKDFSLDIVMLESTRLLNSGTRGKARKEQGEFMQHASSLELFANQGLNTSYFFPLTLSDKDITPMLKAPKWSTIDGDTALSQVVIEDGEVVDIKDKILSTITEYAMGEYNRIYYHQTEGRQKAIEKNVNRGAYEEGANYFYYFDYLNSYNERAAELWEEDGKTLKIGLDKNQVKEYIKEIIKEDVLKEIARNIDTLDRLKISSKYVNNKYFQGATKQTNADLKSEENKIAALVADRALNYIISNNEQRILFTGDPALAYKENKGEFNLPATIKITLNNYEKRGSDLLSPATSPQYTDKQVSTITMFDSKVFKNGSEIERTDGQEYGTALEALEMKFAHGKLPQTIYNKLKKGIESVIADPNNVENYYTLKQFLTDQEYRAVKDVFVTDKPVYIVNDINVELDSNNKFFRKTSTRWLWPEETKGHDIDNLRLVMERLKIRRAGHESSDKKGAINPIQVYDGSGEFLSAEQLEANIVEGNAIRSLDRDGLGWQQEKPVNKKEVSKSTQLDVLAADDLLDLKLSKDRTVEQWRIDKEKIVSDFYKLGAQDLYSRMGITLDDTGRAVDINASKLSKFLKAEAQQRNWSKKDIKELTVIEVAETAERIFRSPLMFNHSRTNIESLVLSLIRKNIANVKLPGYGYIQSSSAGFRAKGGRTWKEFKEEFGKDDVSNVITYINPNSLNAFDETIGLQGPRVNSEGEFLPGQLLIQPHFEFTNAEGKIVKVDLTNRKYSKVSNGKRYLQVDAIPRELLEMIGYRIPGQGRSSVMALEVVGFLPSTSIATAIIPDEMVDQMGSDFDIDILYTYRKMYVVDDQGKIKKKTDLSALQKLQDKYFDAMRELVFNKNYFLATEKLDNNDIETAATEVDKLVKKDNVIDSPSYLTTNISHNISQRTGKKLIGPASLAATLHAAVQGRDIGINPDYNQNLIKFTFFETLEGVLELTNISRKGFSVSENGVKRTSSDNLRSIQNAAVDNANKQTLAAAGVNNATIDVALFAPMYKDVYGNSIHTDQLTYFLRQESIEIYNEQFDYFSSGAEGGYLGFEQIRNRAFNAAMQILDSRIGDGNFQEDYTMSLDELRQDENGKFQTFSVKRFKSLFTDTKNDTYYQTQKAILAGFRQLQVSSDPVKKLQRGIMTPRTKGLGSTIFEAQRALSNMDVIFEDKLSGLAGVADALKNTQFETLYNELKQAYKAFGKVMPFNAKAHSDMITEFQKMNGEKDISSNVRESLFYAMLDKGYARAFENAFEINAEELRRDMLFLSESSLAAKVQNVQNTAWGKRNLFIQRLVPIIKSSLTVPNTVSYTASKQEDVMDQMHKDFIALYQSDIEGHRELFEDLVKFAYATGGNQNARNFVKFVPSAYLQEIGFYDALRVEEQRMLNDQDFNSAQALKEWLQHNPFYATQITEADLTVGQFLQEPVGNHRIKFNGRNQLYQLVLKPINPEIDLPYYKYAYEKDEVLTYIPIIGRKVNNKVQLYEKTGDVTIDGGIIFKRIPLKGYNTNKVRISEYEGIPQLNKEGGTVFSQNAVPTAPGAANPGAAQVPQIPVKKISPTSTPTKPSKYNFKEGDVLDRAGAKELLENVVNETEDVSYRMLARILLDNFDTVGSEIQKVIEAKTTDITNPDGSTETIDIRGEYTDGTVKLNSNYLSKPLTFEEVVLHEYLHGYLVNELANKDSELAKTTKVLRLASIKLLAKKVKNGEIDPDSMEHALLDYAFKNDQEWLVHAMTNKGVQRFLNNQKVKKSIWERFKVAIVRFIQALGDVIGVEVKKDSALATAVGNVLEVVSREETAGQKTAEMANRVGTVTADELIGVIQKDGGFLQRFDLMTHLITAQGKYTQDKIDNAVRLYEERAKFNAEQNLSIPIVKQIDTIQQFIDLYNERIKNLRTKLTNKNITEVEGQRIRERIRRYATQRKSLKDKRTIEQLQIIATAQFRWVKTVLDNEAPTDIEMQEAINITDSYNYSVTNEFLNAEDLTETNVFNKALLDFSKRASGFKARLLDKLIEDVTAEISVLIPEMDVTKKDILEIAEESNLFVYQSLDITKFKSPLVKLINKKLKLAGRAKDIQVAKLFEEISSKIETIKNHPEFKRDPNLFFQKDENGKLSGYFVNEFSDSYRVAKNKYFADYYKKIKKIDETPAKTTAARNAQAKAKNAAAIKLNRQLNNIELAIDIRFWHQDKVLNSSYKSKEEYIEFLDKELGQETRERLVEKALEKYEQYQVEEAANLEIIKADLRDSSPQEVDEAIKRWTQENSPVIALNIRYGKGQARSKQYGYMRLISAPRKNHAVTKKALNFYDSSFNTIKNDKVLNEFYDYYIKTMKELTKVLPESVSRQLPENFWPAARRSFVENLQNDGLASFWKYFSSTELLSYVSINKKAQLDPTIVSEGARDVSTGQPLKTVPIRMIKGVKAQEKSYDLERVLKMFTAMAKNFEFKAEVEDRVLLLQRALREARELQVDSSGNPIKKSDKRTNLSVIGGLKNVQEAVDYAIDAELYGFTKDIDEKGIIINRRANEIQQELKNLDERRAQGALTDAQYNIDKAKLEEEYEKLQVTQFSKEAAIESVIKVTQMKGMGWNVVAGVNNMGFGTMSNFVHAAGEEDFTVDQLSQAYWMVLKSSGSSVVSATKLTHLVSKYGILFEQIDAHYGKDRKREFKFLDNLSPFEIQRRTEFINQTAPFVAKMLNTEVAPGVTLYDAYDENGNWKNEYAEYAEEWSDDLDADTINKFTNFRDASIEMNKVNHGNYDPHSFMLLKKSVYGRAFTIFRTWMFEGFNTRFAEIDYNDQLNRFTKGRWRTYGTVGAKGSLKFLLKGIGNMVTLGNAFSKEDMKGDMETIDYDNMRKNLMEIKFYAAIYGTMLMLKAAAETDDFWAWLYRLLANSLFRLEQDIWFYLHPGTMMDILRNPTPLLKTIGDFTKAIDATISYLDDPQEYEDSQKDPLKKKWFRALPGGSAYYTFEYLTEEIIDED